MPPPAPKATMNLPHNGQVRRQHWPGRCRLRKWCRRWLGKPAGELTRIHVGSVSALGNTSGACQPRERHHKRNYHHKRNCHHNRRSNWLCAQLVPAQNNTSHQEYNQADQCHQQACPYGRNQTQPGSNGDAAQPGSQRIGGIESGMRQGAH